jgi:hypothetical protein
LFECSARPLAAMEGPIQRQPARRVRPWDAKLTESDNFQ